MSNILGTGGILSFIAGGIGLLAGIPLNNIWVSGGSVIAILVGILGMGFYKKSLQKSNDNSNE